MLGYGICLTTLLKPTTGLVSTRKTSYQDVVGSYMNILSSTKNTELWVQAQDLIIWTAV